jgi:hypothetical protein
MISKWGSSPLFFGSYQKYYSLTKSRFLALTFDRSKLLYFNRVLLSIVARRIQFEGAKKREAIQICPSAN